MATAGVPTFDARSVKLAQAVQYLRAQRGLSARGLSAKSGLSPSYVSKLEAEELEPSFKAFARIALVLGMTEKEIAFCVYQEALHGSPPSGD